MSDRGVGVVDVALRNHKGPSDDLTVKKIVNVTVNKSDTARRRWGRSVFSAATDVGWAKKILQNAERRDRRTLSSTSG